MLENEKNFLEEYKKNKSIQDESFFINQNLF